ncbi:MAG: type II CAAX endopeptidase family protein [Candidatus Neomarinimicrobiota bacterium]
MREQFTVRAAVSVVIMSIVLSVLLTSGAAFLLQNNGGGTFIRPVTLIFGESVLLVPVFIFLARRTNNIRRVLRINAVPATTLGITVIFSLGVVVWADEVDRLITSVFPPPDWLPQLLRADDPVSLLLIFLGAVILAAVAEEILFRGFLQSVLENHWKNVTRAVLITSLLFAVIHFNPSGMIQIYLLAILMGYLAWRTNSVFPSIVMHGINNGLAFTFINWGEYLEPWYAWRGHVSPVILIGGAVLTVIGFRRLSNSRG